MDQNLKVADFFCGAGGFSEGFRQAGFDIAFALDLWGPAIETHQLNHPMCKSMQMDILELSSPEIIDKIIPNVDIIIGSPPCVSFSYANRGGNVDKSEGKMLVKAFLRIIAWKKKKGALRYWALENVPALRAYIKQRYTFDELDLPGGNKTALEVNGDLYDASEYGAPQRRIRFICGDFPKPKKAERQITLGDVISALNTKKPVVSDPVYDLKILRDHLTDHYYDTSIPKFRWQEAKRLKLDSGFYGRMSFPDELNRPSRTVMALKTVPSRESIILEVSKSGEYRSPTIREFASIMGFPITYLFQANSEATKQRLIGNAVPPPLSYSIADSIRKTEGLKSTKLISTPVDVSKLRLNLNGMAIKKGSPHDRKPMARFARHIDYLKYRSFRVELDNKSSNFAEDKIIWTAKLHHSTGKEQMKYLEAQSKSVLAKLKESGDNSRIAAFVKDLQKMLGDKIPSAKEFQIQYCKIKKEKNLLSPENALTAIRALIDVHFPDKAFKDITIRVNNRKNSGFHFFGKEVSYIDVPIRFLAGLYACQRIVELTQKEKSA
jgi:DNA (cytosine-5)-methyltransferase 1